MVIVTFNSSRQNAGFILVTTIWFLAIALLAASAFALWTNRSLETVTEQSDATKALIDIHSTRATLLYLLATQPMNSAGLVTDSAAISQKSFAAFDMDSGSLSITGDEIVVDGRSYKGLGLAKFSLQDEAGFININSQNGNIIKKLLIKKGYSARESDAYIDKILDYTDSDSFHRIQGAESYHYKQAKMSPPTNKRFNSELELYNVLGWDKVLQKNPDIIQNLTVNGSTFINLNAATETVLGLMDAISDENAVDIVIRERNERPFQSMSEAAQRTNLPLMQLFESVGTASARTLRLSLWYDGAQTVQQLIIRITPTSMKGKPWQFKSSGIRTAEVRTNRLPLMETASDLLSDSSQ